ncbi:hypothetical protein BAE44_0015981 [Dichanthelium oligosanthes]|uniref:DUF4220 domain-containing protein n=1 Tax=Dichanthelium oligosanthes TaxID=888268 RepID=A0A1E5VCX7_9POAL|nr:hypothetical protein BAE44_0015981 [Dichanthelium oligosanthes]
MATLMQLWNDWELQVLVLLSFMFQAFLFFAGGLRWRSTDTALRLMIWLAYLLADFIAVYALGQLSRQKNGTEVGESHQLVFFWTPFLLIHLGGQETTTAFSVEDSELWLRHLLNLLVQVGLALYVFWKSTIPHNQFLASAIFAFIAGIIKYGERTCALLRKPFEAAILSLHIYTDIFLHRYMNPTSAMSLLNTRETRHLMHVCRTLSEYICYLLVLHPDMLPVSGSVRDVLEKASDTVAKVTGTPANKRSLVEEAVLSHESLHVLARAWVGVLIYAEGKSRGEVHARQLSMGGELLTFLCLHLAHRRYGDQGIYLRLRSFDLVLWTRVDVRCLSGVNCQPPR